ncbi:hypothetical protein SAMN04487970_100131 [Paenibacillus tianmuensis]|uniref:Menaquinol-cytochrome c reductase cytochrome b subunit n=1 Tax=Paenibacillus tianmuensis TaxID=624147 RepID=A0A1G4P475_9BACL|nr:hypothetical protein [Paenibacillus tianmuensis]SCW27070.1 hypothetical protein SAMN04487970_100131 [Paenibacillus tianmuensis]
MVKTIRNALLFAAAVHILYVIVQVVSGMLLTMWHVPKIVDAYSSKQVLESQVSFGVMTSPSIWLYVLTFAGSAALYAFVLQPLLRRWANRRNRS